MHLFFGGRHPCELYDLPTLWQIANCSPWLSVTPVSELPVDPWWADDYPDPEPPRGLHAGDRPAAGGRQRLRRRLG